MRINNNIKMFKSSIWNLKKILKLELDIYEHTHLNKY